MKKLFITTALGLVMPLYAHALSLNIHAEANAGVKAANVATTTKADSKNQTAIEIEARQATQAEIFTACSQTAIDVRDNAIGSARATYNNQMAVALDTRKEAEKSAVALTDEDAKKDAIKKAVDAYKTAFTQAQDTLVKARKDAWAQFETSVNDCRSANGEKTAPAVNNPAAALKASAEVRIDEGKSLKDVILEKLKTLFSK